MKFYITGSGGKKCSLAVAAADITVDMVSDNGHRKGSGGAISSVAKSPMHKLARLAKLAGTSIGRDAINSTGKCC